MAATGAVMQADPLYRCWAHIMEGVSEGERVRTIYMSPCGKPFKQADAVRLRDDYDRLILVCGHYEGIDQRFIDECVDEEISIGDFVLTGGEIPAMAVADAVCRMVPGVLSDPECYENESHWDGLLEFPSIPAPRSGTTDGCLPSCCPATMPMWRNGGASSPSSVPATGVLICMPNST